ncbi:unnamed protein product [Meganyctiphanes norvegica]|uniref:Heme-binding protein 2-like n=1 Tax=Meganyctiphanes norvegica TaxID=48144 RepID=A0AAV2QEN9_MEGNR
MELHGLRIPVTACCLHFLNPFTAVLVVGSTLLLQGCEANVFSAFASSLSSLTTTQPEAAHTVTRTAKGYEERQYGSLKYACRRQTGAFNDQDQTSIFLALFNYINGENNKGIEMDMSVPVSIEVFKNITTTVYNACFYIDPKHQNSPPTPQDADTFIMERPPITLFTRRFGGFADTEEEWTSAAQKLRKLVEQGGDSVRQDIMYWNAYDSPIKFWSRRNEVWLVKQ